MNDIPGSESLRHKRALVTGAGSRLGKAIAIGLGAQGMRVGVHFHTNHSGALDTASQIEKVGGQCILCQADLSSREAARRLVGTANELLGGLDLLVLSAANFDAVPFESIDDDTWDRTLNLNLAAPFAMAQSAAPMLRLRHGNIVFITCSSVVSPFKEHLAYVVAKAGLYQLMRALALKLAPQVRVNAVAPGMVLPPVAMDPQDIDRLAKQLPLRTAGNPEDIVRAVLFLASSSFVTGEQIVVDGGRALSRSAGTT
jgi:pteridine reductase